MKKNENNQSLSVKCGNVSDNFEYLKSICYKKSEELKEEIQISTLSCVEISFWTEDISELICIGKFCKNKEDKIIYELDFSQSTL